MGNITIKMMSNFALMKQIDINTPAGYERVLMWAVAYNYYLRNQN